MDIFLEAVRIALVGMGIVFFALIALIGILYLMNRLLPGIKPEESLLDTAPPPAPLAPVQTGTIPAGDEVTRAAVVAVAVALAMQAARSPVAAGRRSANAPGIDVQNTGHAVGNGQWQGRSWRRFP